MTPPPLSESESPILLFLNPSLSLQLPGQLESRQSCLGVGPDSPPSGWPSRDQGLCGSAVGEGGERGRGWLGSGLQEVVLLLTLQSGHHLGDGGRWSSLRTSPVLSFQYQDTTPQAGY